MTGSNSNIVPTRLAERQEITGSNYRTAIRLATSQFQHTFGFKWKTHSGLSGRHMSTCILINPAKFHLYLDYQSNFKSSHLALIRIEYKIELTHSINSSCIIHCLTTNLHFDNYNTNFCTIRLPVLANDVTTLYTNETRANRVRKLLQLQIPNRS